jgi:HD-like signal output (HDOD) protein
VIRVLFVDDEPGVLDGLARVLRRHRHEWELVFAVGGEAALAELERAPTDILVTDVKMPGIGGDQLLAIAKERFPGTARIVLSGQTDETAALRLVHSAHQVLAKPCPAEEIREALIRTARLQDRLADPVIRAMLGGAAEFLTLPEWIIEIEDVVMDEGSSLADVARVIERHPGVSAKVIHLVSSAFFGIARPVADLREAVVYLGMQNVRYAVLAAHADNAVPIASRRTTLFLEETRRRQTQTAGLARSIMRTASSEKADVAFLAGLFHDVGILALAAGAEKASPRWPDIATALHEIERDQLDGATHAEVGAYVLGLWGLPGEIVEAVAYHHTPAHAESREFDVVAAVHVAQALVVDESGLDVAYLEDIGATAEIPAWREMARQLHEPVC